MWGKYSLDTVTAFQNFGAYPQPQIRAKSRCWSYIEFLPILSLSEADSTVILTAFFNLILQEVRISCHSQEGATDAAE